MDKVGFKVNEFKVKHEHISFTSMTAEKFLIHNCSNRQTVETICERLPQFDVKSPFT